MMSRFTLVEVLRDNADLYPENVRAALTAAADSLQGLGPSPADTRYQEALTSFQEQVVKLVNSVGLDNAVGLPDYELAAYLAASVGSLRSVVSRVSERESAGVMVVGEHMG